jgi:quercetin dioxygenase-like cupin family protein
MATATLELMKKNLAAPDATRLCGRGTLQIAHLEDVTLTRITLQPGWRWSKDVRPGAATELCEVQHIQYVIGGRLMVAMGDGAETELSPGDFAVIPPGHDAWVLGDEPFVAVDYSPAMSHYAQAGR